MVYYQYDYYRSIKYALLTNQIISTLTKKMQ